MTRAAGGDAPAVAALPAHPPAAPTTVPAYPAWFDAILLRAEQHLRARWREVSSVVFAWWADGEESRFLASVELWPDDPAPRVVVRRERSCDWVCCSLPGNWRSVDADPARWLLDGRRQLS